VTTIVPQNPTPLPVQLPLPNTAPQVTITVQTPPPALAQLPLGAVIDAEVAASSAKGATELNTVFGKVAIKTNLPLPENTKLDLQVLRSAPQLQLLIKALNNVQIQLPKTPGESLDKAIKLALQLSVKSGNTPPSSQLQANQGPANAASTPIKLDIGVQIKATLLRPIANLAQSLAQPSGKSISQPQGTIPQEAAKATLLNTLGKALQSAQNISDKVQAGLQKSGPAVAEKQVRSNSAPAKDTSNIATKIANQLKAGTQFGLKFVGTGNSTAQAVQNTAAPNVINGTVVATTPAGQPILNTPLGMMAIDTRVPLPPGQNLRLEILPNQIQIPSATSAEARFEAMFLSREWPNLANAIREIGRAAPAVTQKLVSSKLPQPNTQLTSNTLFFLNALKGGDMRSWMGNAATSLLDQLNPDLLGQLDEDFVQLGRAATEPQANDWRTTLVPFFNGMGLEQFQMHTQGQLLEGEDGNREEGSRFIIDISLSRLGRLQLDGLVRAKGKRLDLIVRSDGPLPRKMSSDITKIYIDFTEAVAVTGQISFQADQKFVEISMPQLTDHPNKGIVI
jgi:hypothetical protein